MKFSVLVSAGFLTFAAGSPGREPEGHQYQRNPADSQSCPPSVSLCHGKTTNLDTADRSPCPGLNALANHGFLPRSGKDIDLATFQSAIAAAYNYEPTSLDVAFNQAIDFKLSTTGNSSTFHLEDLAKHDAIEMDGSQSRNDFFLGDNLHFDPVIWGSVAKNLNLYKTGPSEADKYVTVEVAARARAARVRDAMKANKHFNASAAQMQGSPGTTALYLTTLWDAKADASPKAWIKAFFGMFLSHHLPRRP